MDIPEELIQLLSCSLCRGSYSLQNASRFPKELRCYHCFCAACVQLLSGCLEVVCPRCGLKTPLPPLCDLPTNESLMFLLKQLPALQLGIAMLHQQNEQQLQLQPPIVLDHGRNPNNQEPYGNRMDQMNVESLLSHGIEQCPVHVLSNTTWCHTCQRLMCSDCSKDVEHKNHEVTHHLELAELLRQLLSNELAKVEDCVAHSSLLALSDMTLLRRLLDACNTMHQHITDQMLAHSSTLRSIQMRNWWLSAKNETQRKINAGQQTVGSLLLLLKTLHHQRCTFQDQLLETYYTCRMRAGVRENGMEVLDFGRLHRRLMTLRLQPCQLPPDNVEPPPALLLTNFCIYAVWCEMQQTVLVDRPPLPAVQQPVQQIMQSQPEQQEIQQDVEPIWQPMQQAVQQPAQQVLKLKQPLLREFKQPVQQKTQVPMQQNFKKSVQHRLKQPMLQQPVQQKMQEVAMPPLETSQFNSNNGPCNNFDCTCLNYIGPSSNSSNINYSSNPTASLFEKNCYSNHIDKQLKKTKVDRRSLETHLTQVMQQRQTLEQQKQREKEKSYVPIRRHSGTQTQRYVTFNLPSTSTFSSTSKTSETATTAAIFAATTPPRKPVRLTRQPHSSSYPVYYLDMEIEREPAGRILIEVRNDVAPLMAQNFHALIMHERGFGYKGCDIFQAWSNESIITGDFEMNTGRGGYAALDDHFFMPDESGLFARRGTVGMRRGQKRYDNCGFVGSQFRMVLNDISTFTAIFGYIVSGIDVLDKVANSGNAAGYPLLHTIIKNCGEHRRASF